MASGLRYALLILLPALLLGGAFLFYRSRRTRERRLRELLDLADAVQALLARASERMTAWRGVVGRLAGDLGSGAQQALDGEPLIREAKRDLLQHRLWIQSSGLTASSAELAEAHAALERAHDRLAEQLAALESAGDALTQATDAAHEAARREPASLRRPPDGGEPPTQG
jgi:HAMP domain-containing protein